jgi:hypothetical protein
LKQRESILSLTRKIEDLDKRLTRLENRGIEGFRFGATDSEKAKGPGPKIRLARRVLVSRRGDLIAFLSAHWPEVTRILDRASSATELETALSAYMRQPYSTPGVDHLGNNTDPLWAFIHSGRFKGSLLHLANAMAGVPEYSWRTSENILSQALYPGSLGLRYIRDYLERHFPERLRELYLARDPREQVNVLMRARTDDVEVKFLLRHPDKISEILAAGLPRPPSEAVFAKHTDALNVAERLVFGQ